MKFQRTKSQVGHSFRPVPSILGISTKVSLCCRPHPRPHQVLLNSAVSTLQTVEVALRVVVGRAPEQAHLWVFISCPPQQQSVMWAQHV